MWWIIGGVLWLTAGAIYGRMVYRAYMVAMPNMAGLATMIAVLFPPLALVDLAGFLYLRLRK